MGRAAMPGTRARSKPASRRPRIPSRGPAAASVMLGVARGSRRSRRSRRRSTFATDSGPDYEGGEGEDDPEDQDRDKWRPPGCEPTPQAQQEWHRQGKAEDGEEGRACRTADEGCPCDGTDVVQHVWREPGERGDGRRHPAPEPLPETAAANGNEGAFVRTIYGRHGSPGSDRARAPWASVRTSLAPMPTAPETMNDRHRRCSRSFRHAGPRSGTPGRSR